MGRPIATTEILERRLPVYETGFGANAVVVVSQGEYVGTYVVEELSSGGALVVGRCPLAPGDRIEALLQTGRTMTVPIKGRIAQIQREAIAIVFVGLTASARRALEDLLHDTTENTGEPAALLVHPDAQERETLKRDLEALGQTVVAFESCDHVLPWLDGALANVAVALVHPDIEERSHLLGIVGKRFPDARRILIFDPVFARGSLSKMIHSSSTHRLLYSPWTRLSLTSALFFSGFPKLHAQRCLETNG